MKPAGCGLSFLLRQIVRFATRTGVTFISKPAGRTRFTTSRLENISRYTGLHSQRVWPFFASLHSTCSLSYSTSSEFPRVI